MGQRLGTAVRQANLAAVLELTHLDGPLRRSELTHKLGLNRSTTGSLVAELVDLGLVLEEDPEAHGRGRPSSVVCAAPNIGVYAAEIGADRARLEIVGLGGTVLASEDLGVRPARDGVARTTQVAGLVGQAMGAAMPELLFVGVGVALHAAVGDGRIAIATNLAPWAGLDAASLTGAATEVAGEIGDAEDLAGPPIFIGNSANLGALAEYRRGAGRGASSLLYLAADRGVSAGMVLGGEVYEGVSGLAGEVGHMKVEPRGLPCSCGASGCWETRIGEAALLEGTTHRSLTPVLTAASAGDKQSRRSVRDAARWLGHGIGTLINVLQPSHVVLGGHLAPVMELERETFDEALARAGLPALVATTTVLPGALGADAAAIGAAEHAFLHLLHDPAAVVHQARARNARMRARSA